MRKSITPAFDLPGPEAPGPGLSDDEILSAAARILAARRRSNGARRVMAPCACCGELLTARQRRAGSCPACGRHPVQA